MADEKNPAAPATPQAAQGTKAPDIFTPPAPVQGSPETKPEGTPPEKVAGDTSAGKVADDKAPADKAATDAVYDLKLPKDTLLEPGAAERIAAEAKAQGLSNEAAQALLEREHAAIGRFNAYLAEETAKVVQGWEQQIRTDPEIGGKDYERNMIEANRLLDKVAPEGFKEMLKKTGFGSHPDFMRVMVRLSKGSREDRFVHAGAAAPRQREPWEIFYPGDNKKE